MLMWQTNTCIRFLRRSNVLMLQVGHNDSVYVTSRSTGYVLFLKVFLNKMKKKSHTVRTVLIQTYRYISSLIMIDFLSLFTFTKLTLSFHPDTNDHSKQTVFLYKHLQAVFAWKECSIIRHTMRSFIFHHKSERASVWVLLNANLAIFQLFQLKGHINLILKGWRYLLSFVLILNA